MQSRPTPGTESDRQGSIQQSLSLRRNEGLQSADRQGKEALVMIADGRFEVNV